MQNTLKLVFCITWFTFWIRGAWVSETLPCCLVDRSWSPTPSVMGRGRGVSRWGWRARAGLRIHPGLSVPKVGPGSFPPHAQTKRLPGVAWKWRVREWLHWWWQPENKLKSRVWFKIFTMLVVRQPKGLEASPLSHTFIETFFLRILAILRKNAQIFRSYLANLSHATFQM